MNREIQSLPCLWRGGCTTCATCEGARPTKGGERGGKSGGWEIGVAFGGLCGVCAFDVCVCVLT